MEENTSKRFGVISVADRQETKSYVAPKYSPIKKGKGPRIAPVVKVGILMALLVPAIAILDLVSPLLRRFGARPEIVKTVRELEEGSTAVQKFFALSNGEGGKMSAEAVAESRALVKSTRELEPKVQRLADLLRAEKKGDCAMCNADGLLRSYERLLEVVQVRGYFYEALGPEGLSAEGAEYLSTMEGELGDFYRDKVASKQQLIEQFKQKYPAGVELSEVQRSEMLQEYGLLLDSIEQSERNLRSVCDQECQDLEREYSSGRLEIFSKRLEAIRFEFGAE